MDIVTAGRACLRRWYLFIPIIIIGVLASLHIANATKPTYEATGSFIVLNSATRPVTVKQTTGRTPAGKGSTSASATPTPTPTSTVENPYSGNQDLLRGALQDVLNGSGFRQQVAAAGLKGSFSVAIAKKQPIFDVTADARHRAQAVALANGVLARANAALHSTQTAAGAPADSLLNTQVINKADGASDVTSGKSKRLVAGVVVTAAAAIALSIALDSLVLAIRRRRSASDAGSAAAFEGAPVDQPSNTSVIQPEERQSPTPTPAPARATRSGAHAASKAPTKAAAAGDAMVTPDTAEGAEEDETVKSPLGRLSGRSRRSSS